MVKKSKSGSSRGVMTKILKNEKFGLPWKTIGARTNLSSVSLFSGCKVWHCCDCVACIMSIHLCLLFEAAVLSKLPLRLCFLVSTAVGWLNRTKRTNRVIPNCFFISLNVWNFFFIILSVRFSILYMQWRQSNFPVSQKSTKTVKLTRGYCEHCPVIKRFIETHSSKLLYMFNSKSTVTRLQRMTKRPKPDRRRAKSNDIKQTESHLLNTSEYISLICCAIIFTLLKHKQCNYWW